MVQSDVRLPTVFVIDDDADIRASIAGLLNTVGLRVETFESAEEFLSRQRSDEPGCLVLDFTLSSMNGFEAQRALSTAGVHIPIIFISGDAELPASARAMKSGAVKFLIKPFRDQDLLDAIEKALDRDRMTRQKQASVPTESQLAAFSQSVLKTVESGRPPMATATEIRKSGIDVVGDMVAWGAHFCLFYETKEDLLDTLTSYCRSGLERGEYCMWIVADPLTIEEATAALKRAVPDVDRHLADSRMEMTRARDWFLKGGTFDGKSLTQDWYDKLARVSARGYPGMRVTGDTTWLSKKDWTHFCDYEDGLNEVIGNQRLAVLCTYPLSQCGAPQILDVVKTHQFVLARRHGSWDVVETATLKQAKSEIKQLNEELEKRVVERSSELMKASVALREAQTELAHINRVTAMGQLAASIVHETMQPISSAVTNAHAALRSLSTEPPDVGAAREAIDRIVKNGSRASDVIGRLRALSKKAPPVKDSLEINEAVLDVIALTRGEVVKNGISLRTELAEGLPRIQADRVQLQQVILNLIMNAVEAVSDVREGPRALLVATERDATGGVILRVTDSGPGLSSESFDRVFEAFYTTKPRGMGMGLSICRTIVEAHGGRIWASRGAGPGATLQFALPAPAV